jgi:hypothetical protein
MEAAISSSLSHPNIVQTYTYTIRPMRDNSNQQQPTQQLPSSGDNAVVEATYETSKQDVNSGGSGGSANVHSYEVGVGVSRGTRPRVKGQWEALGVASPVAL